MSTKSIPTDNPWNFTEDEIKKLLSKLPKQWTTLVLNWQGPRFDAESISKIKAGQLTTVHQLESLIELAELCSPRHDTRSIALLHSRIAAL